jgi:Phosphotransferase system cellobiose-specific component IIB
MYILLVCSAGMSTSLIVSRMQDAAKKKDMDIRIEAHPVSHVEGYGKEADVILLGPQVRYQLKNVKQSFPDKPVEIINMQDYGMVNGEKILSTTLNLLEK